MASSIAAVAIKAPTVVVSASQANSARAPARVVMPARFGRSMTMQTSKARSLIVRAEEEAAAEAAPAAEEAVPAAEASAEAEEGEYNPQFQLRFVWLEKNVAVAVDQVYAKGAAPLTEYFFWPRKDAWEELKTALDATPWISERDVVLMLNKTTEVINFWQEEGAKHSLAEAKAKFPDCQFLGA